MNIKIKQLLLFIGDALLLYLSLYFMFLIRFDLVRSFLFHPTSNIQHLTSNMWQQHFWPFSAVFIFWLIAFYIAGFYGFISRQSGLAFFWKLLKVLGINALVAMSFFYIVPNLVKGLITPKTNIFITLAIFGILIALWRWIFYSFMRSRGLVNNLAIVGTNDQVRELAKKIKNSPRLGYKLALIIGSGKSAARYQIPGVQYINTIPQSKTLKWLLKKKNIRTIVTAQNPRSDGELVKKLYRCLSLKVDFIDFPHFYENLTGKVPVSVIGQVWFLENLRESQKRNYEKIRRVIDIAFSLGLGAILAVFFPFVAAAIKINSSGPVFYRQRRVGRNGKEFRLLKFRSMVKDAEIGKAQWAQEKDPRITRVGRFLRKTLIDELPQIINILKGEMSLVGPRPERPEFVRGLFKDIPHYQVRHLVKPGMVGWAQIKFRYGVSKEDALEKLQYDLYYLKNRSLLLDLGIFLKTINIITSRFRKKS